MKRRFRADRPDQVWAADITAAAISPRTRGGSSWRSRTFSMSARARWWAGRCASTLDAAIVVDAVSMAVTRRRPPAGVVHHSDRGGSQYTSLALGKTLRDSGIVASMGSRGDAYDNALAESFMSTTHQARADQSPNLDQPRPSQAPGLQLHRELLQPPAPPRLQPRNAQPRRIRETTKNQPHGGHSRLNQKCQPKRGKPSWKEALPLTGDARTRFLHDLFRDQLIASGVK